MKPTIYTTTMALVGVFLLDGVLSGGTETETDKEMTFRYLTELERFKSERELESAAAQEATCPYTIPEVFQSSYVELAQHIVRPEIPESHLYRTGITVDEKILSQPEMATRKSHTLTTSDCTDKSWIGGRYDLCIY